MKLVVLIPRKILKLNKKSIEDYHSIIEDFNKNKKDKLWMKIKKRIKSDEIK